MDCTVTTRTSADLSPPSYGRHYVGQLAEPRRVSAVSRLGGGFSNFDTTSRSLYVEAISASLATSTKQVSPVPYVIPAASVPTALDLALEGVRRLAELDADWDGYNSTAPLQEARDDAEIFAAHNAGLLEMALPHISPASDGEVNFYWKNGRGLLDLGFYGDGTYSFYAEMSDGSEFAGDGLDLQQPLPRELLQLFKVA